MLCSWHWSQLQHLSNWCRLLIKLCMMVQIMGEQWWVLFHIFTSILDEDVWVYFMYSHSCDYFLLEKTFALKILSDEEPYKLLWMYTNLIALLVVPSYITWVSVLVERLLQLHIFGVLNQKQRRSDRCGCGSTLLLLKRPWRVSSFCVKSRWCTYSASLTC